MAKGRRASVKTESKPRIEFEAKQRVILDQSGEKLYGRIKTVQGGIVYVRIDPEQWQIEKGERGDLLEIRDDNAQRSLTHQPCTNQIVCGHNATKMDGLCDDCRLIHNEPKEKPEKRGGREQKAFNAYGIKWTQEDTHFAFKPMGEEVRFYGWWRRGRNERSQEHYYSVDIFAVRGKEEFTVDSIHYETDPRLSMNSLNADLCAAANKWWHGKLDGSKQNLDELIDKSQHPKLYINRLATVDALILKLKEYRDTCIRAGGERHIELKGDSENPAVLLTMNLTSQSFALKGKPPSLITGAIYDSVKDGRQAGKGERAKQLTITASPENVQAMVQQLAKAKEVGDKKTQRLIRAELRKMGHKGGARALSKT